MRELLKRQDRPAGQIVNGQLYRPQAELTLGRPVSHAGAKWDRDKIEEYRNIEFWCRRNAPPAECAYVRAELTPTGWIARYFAPAQHCDRLYRVILAGNARVVGLSRDFELV